LSDGGMMSKKNRSERFTIKKGRAHKINRLRDKNRL
jgi:hypothetical protein